MKSSDGQETAHTAVVFLKPEKSVCRDKQGGHALWKDETPVKHLN